MKPFFVLIAAPLFLVGALGVSHFGMEMGEQMTNCPFMLGQATICTMNPLEHIAAWQNVFTAVARENIFAFFVFASLTFLFFGHYLSVYRIPSASALYIDRRRVEIPVVFSPLKEAFFRGTLHPKIF